MENGIDHSYKHQNTKQNLWLSIAETNEGNINKRLYLLLI